MNRFFGMMPIDEIGREDRYKGGVIVQAGENGWAVVWGDGSCDWEDCVGSVDENMEKARKVLRKNRPDLVEDPDLMGEET